MQNLIPPKPNGFALDLQLTQPRLRNPPLIIERPRELAEIRRRNTIATRFFVPRAAKLQLSKCQIHARVRPSQRPGDLLRELSLQRLELLLARDARFDPRQVFALHPVCDQLAREALEWKRSAHLPTVTQPLWRSG